MISFTSNMLQGILYSSAQARWLGTYHLVVLSVMLLLMIGQCHAYITNTTIAAGTCVCNTEDAALYAKAGYEHPIRRYLLRNHCTTATGQSAKIFGEAWFELTVDEQDLWTSGDYLAYAHVVSGACGIS